MHFDIALGRRSIPFCWIWTARSPDLAFDNYFWQTLVPETWGAARGLNLQEAKEAMRQEYHAVQHTLNWYCLDYWSERLVWIFVR